MRFTGNGITNCYPDEVDNFVSITVLTVGFRPLPQTTRAGAPWARGGHGVAVAAPVQQPRRSPVSRTALLQLQGHLRLRPRDVTVYFRTNRVGTLTWSVPWTRWLRPTAWLLTWRNIDDFVEETGSPSPEVQQRNGTIPPGASTRPPGSDEPRAWPRSPAPCGPRAAPRIHLSQWSEKAGPPHLFLTESCRPPIPTSPARV